LGLKNCMIIVIVLIIGAFPFFSLVSADEDITVKINMIGESAQIRFDSPVIVAGIWHYINLTLEEQNYQTINLKFYNGSSMPSIGNRDESSYYEWTYNTNTQEWKDLNEYDGYSYINDTSCQKKDNIYSFCIGVKDALPEITNYYENWTLEIYADGNELYSKNVVLEKPTIGISKTHDDVIRFNVDPFTETDVYNDEDYFIIGNVGNIPLYIAIDYGIYTDIVDVRESGKTLSPDDTFNHYVTLHSESWKAGILEIPGSTSGSVPSGLIITTASITFETSFLTQAADLEISVGHSNYTITEIPGTHVVFQYEESLEMNEGQIKDIIVYISGAGQATLDIWSDELNVAILKISSRDQTGTPLTITSTNTSEYAVTIRVEAIRENKVGVISYELEIDGDVQTFTTQITIGPPLQEKKEGTNISVTSIIVALCIILLIVYLILSQIRHRRR